MCKLKRSERIAGSNSGSLDPPLPQPGGEAKISRSDQKFDGKVHSLTKRDKCTKQRATPSYSYSSAAYPFSAVDRLRRIALELDQVDCNRFQLEASWDEGFDEVNTSATFGTTGFSQHFGKLRYSRLPLTSSDLWLQKR